MSPAWFGRRANQLRDGTELWTINETDGETVSLWAARERKRRVGSGQRTDGSVELVSS